jgi:uncharacterized protein YpmB
MKKYIGLTLLVLTVLIAASIYAIHEITFAQYTGAEESAQYALDNTVLNKIAEVTPYTGGMNGFFIRGTDELGRELYVWTQNGKSVAVQYADQGLSRDKAIEAAKKPAWAVKLVRDNMKEQPLQPVQDVVHALPGPVLPKSTTEYRTAESGLVWEIYGKLANGDMGYTYLDFKSGAALWQIAMPDQK